MGQIRCRSVGFPSCHSCLTSSFLPSSDTECLKIDLNEEIEREKTKNISFKEPKIVEIHSCISDHLSECEKREIADK